MKKVDETIDTICDWIQTNLKGERYTEDKSATAEMIKALAALVSARNTPDHPLDTGISVRISRGVADAINEETKKAGKSPLFI